MLSETGQFDRFFRVFRMPTQTRRDLSALGDVVSLTPYLHHLSSDSEKVESIPLDYSVCFSQMCQTKNQNSHELEMRKY